MSYVLPMSRTENAERIALNARVFARKANNQAITTLAIWETATVLGIDGQDFSMRTVKTILRRELKANDETNLIGF